MQPTRSHEPLDVFVTFERRVEHSEPEPHRTSGRSVAVTAGAALAAIVVTALAFVIGLRWGMEHTPDPVLANPSLGALTNVIYSLACGAILAVVALTACALTLGIPYVRRHASRRG